MSTSTVSRVWPAALGCAALCTAYLAFFTPFPAVTDERLALPIARAVADSTLYPSTDLIVSSGLRGPFHLYRLAGELYRAWVDVDLVWLGALVAILFATFAAAFATAHTIARNTWIAALAVALLAAASPYRGTLHWFRFPPENLVTSTLATPLVIAAIALAVRGRWGPGLLIAALTFNIHPSVGLLTSGAIALAMIGADGLDWRRRAAWWVAAVACAAPNALFVLRGSAANFGPAPAASGFTFAQLFGIYAHHVWIADHWRENYGWFLMQLGGFLLLRRHLPTDVRRRVALLVAALLGIAIIWFINLYTINYPALTLLFGVRTAPLVKVLMFAAISAAVVRWVSLGEGRARVVRWAIALLLLAGALHKNLDIGEGFAAIAWGGIAFIELSAPFALRIAIAAALAGTGAAEVLGQGWGILGVAPFSSEPVDQVRLAVIMASGAFFTAAALRPTPTEPAAPPPRQLGLLPALACCAGVLFAALVLRGSVVRLKPSSLATIRNAARLAEPHADIADLVRWAPRGSTRGSLFAIPPADDRFNAFRLAAERGVFASTNEVDQLSYDLSVYGTEHARLLAQGLVVRGRHDFDGTAWDTLSAPRLDSLAAEGVEYAVFATDRRLTRPLTYPVVYQDARWIVYRVKRSR